MTPSDTAGRLTSSGANYRREIHEFVDPVVGNLTIQLKLLFVIDSRVQVGFGADDFGLGPALETLREQWVRWVRVEVDVADRDFQWPPQLPWGGKHVRWGGFRFDQPSFDIDEYDQIWLFGDRPGSLADDDPSDDGSILPFALDDGELRLIAQWMDRGGGVFATGDHGILGAALSSRIPRVRKMRRWTHAQNVPRGHDATRNQTWNLDGLDEDDDRDAEMDSNPQRLELVDQLDGPPFFQFAPHPLLCGLTGIIDQFPDHMHEGAVFDDDDVRLNDPLDIPGYSGVEFPRVPNDVIAAAALPGEAELFSRPRPQAIAYANTTVRGQPPRRFPVVSVWDGDSVGRGRIVVDSTWHHWFSMNLLPLRDDNPTVYRDMQDYQRNVALWLATPGQRRWMLIAATWNVILTSDPRRFDVALTPWQFGSRALDVIGRAAPQCVISELVGAFDGALVRAAAAGASRVVPQGVGDRIIVGAVGRRLIKLVGKFVNALHGGDRPHLDLERVHRAALNGVDDGRRALVEHLDEARVATDVLRARYAGPVVHGDIHKSAVVSQPFGPVVMVVERIQLANEADPLFVDDGVHLTLRVQLGWSQLYEGSVELGDEEFEIARVEVQPGEKMSIQVAAAVAGGVADGGVVCFVDDLGGEARGWLGRHVPDPANRLRVWYRLALASPSSITAETAGDRDPGLADTRS